MKAGEVRIPGGKGKGLASLTGEMGNHTLWEYSCFQGPSGNPNLQGWRKSPNFPLPAQGSLAKSLPRGSRLSPPPLRCGPALRCQSGFVRARVPASGGRRRNSPRRGEDGTPPQPGTARPAPSAAPPGPGRRRRSPAAATYPTCCCSCSRCCCRRGRCYCCGSEAVFSRAVNQAKPGPAPTPRAPSRGDPRRPGRSVAGAAHAAAGDPGARERTPGERGAGPGAPRPRERHPALLRVGRHRLPAPSREAGWGSGSH